VGSLGEDEIETRWQFAVLCLGSEAQVSISVHSFPPTPTAAMGQLDSLSRLMETLKERAETRPPGSYTTKLVEGGIEKIGKKIREEAEELIEAAAEPGEEGRRHFIYEAGDLFFHTLVLLAHRGVHLDEVAAELARREGVSGLAEKASRKS